VGNEGHLKKNKKSKTVPREEAMKMDQQDDRKITTRELVEKERTGVIRLQKKRFLTRTTGEEIVKGDR